MSLDSLERNKSSRSRSAIPPTASRLNDFAKLLVAMNSSKPPFHFPKRKRQRRGADETLDKVFQGLLKDANRELASLLRDLAARLPLCPMGGSRAGGEWKTVKNLFVTMVLAGLWHGANWTYVIFGEGLSDYLLKHHSETYARVSQQYADALRVRHAGPGEPLSVLMVGNSLLLYGVDVDRLQELTSSQLSIPPIFLEAPGYYDWLYALKRLFRDGSRPQVIVLGVGVNAFLNNGVRQDYAPLMFFDLKDAANVAHDLRFDNTETSDLLLARSSAFCDTRSVIRMQILRHTVPHCRELFLLLKPQPAIPPPPQFAAIANPRLERLRQLCASYGAKLILLVPPTPSSEDAVHQMTLASRKAGVETLVPVDPAVLSVHYYEPDEIHLNSEGAAIFTVALATYLPRQLAHESFGSPN